MAQGAIRSVYMTFPDQESALSISSRLLEEGLIACANVLPAARSLYVWKGAVHDESEVVAFAKTSAQKVPELVSRVEELHPYDVPCVVALTIEGGSADYLAWVADETSREGE